MRIGKISFWLAAVAIALSAASCDVGGGPTKIDGSSQSAFHASIQKATAELSPADQSAFTKAMMIIAFKDIGDAAGTGGLAGAVAAMPKSEDAAFSKLSALANGKTATEIIAEAGKVQKERTSRQTIADQTQIDTLTKQISDTATAQAAAQTVLVKLVIKGARFYFPADQIIQRPVVDFSITNGSELAIKKAFFHATLTTPGRPVPWVDDDFNYDIPGGLNPGESQRLQLSPNMFSKWGNADLKARRDLVLTVVATDAVAADGTHVLKAEPIDTGDVQRRIDTLQKEIKAMASGAL
jgi:hypothetical protein